MATVIDQIAIALELDPKQLAAGIKKAAKNVDAGTKKMAGRFESLKKSVFNVRSAFTGLVGAYVVRDFITKSNAQEEAVSKLIATLKKEGIYTEALSESLQELASDIQGVTTEGDELTLSNIALMQNLGHLSEDAIPDATRAAIGLAKVMGVDSTTAFKLLGRAASGNTDMFTRYGITLDKTLSDQEKFNELLRIGADGFQLAEAEAKTGAGAIKQFGNLVGDLKEKLGDLIKEALLPVLGVLKKVVVFFNDMDASARKAIFALTAVAAVIYKVVVPALTALHLSAGPIGWALMGIAAAVTGGIALWDRYGAETKRASEEVQAFTKRTSEALSTTQRLLLEVSDLLKEMGEDAKDMGEISLTTDPDAATRLMLLKNAAMETQERVVELQGRVEDLGTALAMTGTSPRIAEAIREQLAALEPRLALQEQILQKAQELLKQEIESQRAHLESEKLSKEEQKAYEELLELRAKMDSQYLDEYISFLREKQAAIEGQGMKEVLARTKLEAKIQGLIEGREAAEQRASKARETELKKELELRRRAAEEARKQADTLYAYQSATGRIALEDQITHLQTELALAEDGTLRKYQLEDELARKKQALWEQTHAAEIAMQAQAISVMMAGYDTLWQTITDRAMTGKQRLEAMWDAMRQQFVRIVAYQVRAFIFGEKVKQTESKKTTAVLIGEYIVQAAQAIWAAGASVVSAIASGFKWLVATLGPFGLAAGIALGAGIIAAFMGFKSAMGFESGGYTGEGGKEEPAGIVHKGEYVVPQWIVKKHPEMVQTIEAVRERGYQVGGMVREVIRPEKIIQAIETIREREFVTTLERMRTGTISTLTRTPSLRMPAMAPAGAGAGSAQGGGIVQHVSLTIHNPRVEDLPEIKQYVRDEILPELRRLEKKGVGV